MSNLYMLLILVSLFKGKSFHLHRDVVLNILLSISEELGSINKPKCCYIFRSHLIHSMLLLYT
jgi:hypothetical protein